MDSFNRSCSVRKSMFKFIFALFCVVVYFDNRPVFAQVIPRGGDIVQGGGNFTIQWDTSTWMWGGDPTLSGGNVSITLWSATAGTWTTVASSVACSAGSYTWSVPYSLWGSGFRIIITSLVNPAAYLISDSYFTIRLMVQNKPAQVVPAALPDNAMFLTAAPNPFNQLTTVFFSIPITNGNHPAQVRVYNILGVDVTTLVNDIKPAGQYSVMFDGTQLPSGQYIVSVKLANHTQSKMVVLAK